MKTNVTSQELFDVFSECFDSILGRSLGTEFHEIESDIQRLKEGKTSLCPTYRAFSAAVFEQRLKAFRLGIPTEGFHNSIVNAARRFAQTHSLEDLTFEESRGSSALSLLWKFMQWQRKEQGAK